MSIPSRNFNDQSTMFSFIEKDLGEKGKGNEDSDSGLIISIIARESLKSFNVKYLVSKHGDKLITSFTILAKGNNLKKKMQEEVKAPTKLKLLTVP